VFQRHRHGAGNTGLPAGTATVRAGGHSERLFYRGDNRPPRARRYSASKGAVLSLTLAMAADLLRDGIRVNAVTPGTTDTPWIGRLLDRAQDPEAERAALNASRSVQLGLLARSWPPDGAPFSYGPCPKRGPGTCSCPGPRMRGPRHHAARGSGLFWAPPPGSHIRGCRRGLGGPRHGSRSACNRGTSQPDLESPRRGRGRLDATLSLVRQCGKRRKTRQNRNKAKTHDRPPGREEPCRWPGLSAFGKFEV
jgi:hypothetical protein